MPLILALDFLTEKFLLSAPALIFVAFAGFCATFLILRCKQECVGTTYIALGEGQREGLTMSLAFKQIIEIGEQVSQFEEENRVSSEHLEQIARLEKHIQNSPQSAEIADKVTQIQCLVDEVNRITERKAFYLLSKKVKQAISEIEKFHQHYHEPLPDKIFRDLTNGLDVHTKSIKTIKKMISFLDTKNNRSLEEITFGMKIFASALEGNLELLPYHVICDAENFYTRFAANVRRVGIQQCAPISKKKGFLPNARQLEAELVKSFEHIIEMAEKAKTYVLSTQSAETKAVERIQNIDSTEWETVLEPGQEINIEGMNAWLERRGYKTQVPCEDSSSS